MELDKWQAERRGWKKEEKAGCMDKGKAKRVIICKDLKVKKNTKMKN